LDHIGFGSGIRRKVLLLLQAHEQVIYLLGLVLGLVLLDFAKGKGVKFPVVAEKNSVAADSFLQGRHDAVLRSIAPISGKRLYQNFTTRLAKENGKRSGFAVTPCPD